MVAVSAAAALRLRAEMGHDLAQLARVRAEITSRAGRDDDTTTYALALLLMNYDTGVEKLLRRVALVFGDLPPARERWHAELLDGATLDIPGLRPRCCERQPPSGSRTCFDSAMQSGTCTRGRFVGPTSTAS